MKKLNITKEQVQNALNKALELQEEIKNLNILDDYDSDSISYAGVRIGQTVIRLQESLENDFNIK